MRILILLCGLLVAVLLLGGCSASTAVSPAAVFALETDVSIAETLALTYTRLPACPVPSNVCADPATKVRLKRNGRLAYEAVVRLRDSSAAGAPAAYAVAVAALAALQASTPPIPVAN